MARGDEDRFEHTLAAARRAVSLTDELTRDGVDAVAIGTATFRLAAPGTRRHRNED